MTQPTPPSAEQRASWIGFEYGLSADETLAIAEQIRAADDAARQAERKRFIQIVKKCLRAGWANYGAKDLADDIEQAIRAGDEPEREP